MGTINWGLIGCGDIAVKRVAPAMRDLPGHVIKAIARKDTSRLAGFAEKFGAERTCQSAEELIEDPDINAVYLATPVNLHLPHTLLAARAGKHVLCEKPMALDTAECDRMIEACEKAGVLLGIAYYRRFYPAVLKIKEILKEGGLGQPVLARTLAAEYWDFPQDHPFRWRLTMEQGGGGPLMDFGSHRIDILLDIMGAVRQVSAFTDRLLFEREVEDSALVVMRHDSGAQSIVGAYHTIGPHGDELEVFGSSGSITMKSLNSGIMEITRHANQVEVLQKPPHENFHLPLIEDFGLAVNQGRKPGITGETGRETSRIMEAAYRASREGVTVKIEG